jgi:hypothetical protein
VGSQLSDCAIPPQTPAMILLVLERLKFMSLIYTTRGKG